MRRLALLVIAAVMLAACAQPVISGQGSAPKTGGPSQDQRVGPHSLEKWKGFPVTADPRPIVLLDNSQIRIQEGFATGEAKLAFGAGLVDPNGKLAGDGPKSVKVGGKDFPALTAAEAFTLMTNAEKNSFSGPTPAPIKVTSVKLDNAQFWTDRGEQELPAWLFDLTDTLGPIAVLAFKADWMSVSRLGVGSARHSVSTDGLTLSVTLPAAPSNCPGQPEGAKWAAETLESDTAVAVGLHEVSPGSGNQNCFRDMALHMTQYTVKLAKPLGNRVLVDAHGGAMAISL